MRQKRLKWWRKIDVLYKNKFIIKQLIDDWLSTTLFCATKQVWDLGFDFKLGIIRVFSTTLHLVAEPLFYKILTLYLRKTILKSSYIQ